MIHCGAAETLSRVSQVSCAILQICSATQKEATSGGKSTNLTGLESLEIGVPVRGRSRAVRHCDGVVLRKVLMVWLDGECGWNPEEFFQ